VVFAEWAAFRACLTADTRLVPAIASKPITAAVIAQRSRRRQDGGIPEVAFIAESPTGISKADSMLHHTLGSGERRILAGSRAVILSSTHSKPFLNTTSGAACVASLTTLATIGKRLVEIIRWM
jgi:hypothetical protein